MAEIRPFAGLRFNSAVVGDLSAVMTPPYDVIGAAEQAEYYRRNPHNIVRLELGEQLPGDTPQHNRYTRAAGFLADWLRRGAIVEESVPALYVYRHTYVHQGRRLTRTGFFSALRLEEWAKGIVLPHEKTMSGPKQDRLQLMRATAANCSPIFALYDDPDGLARQALFEAMSARPLLAFEWDCGAEAEGASEEHLVWAISDPDIIARVCHVVADRAIYIADGHHRYETALHYRYERRAEGAFAGDEAWQFVLTLLVAVDDPGLLVLPTHRLVNPRGSLDRGRPNSCSEAFRIEALHQADLATALSLLAQRGEDARAFAVYDGERRLSDSGYALLLPRSEEQVARLMPPDRKAAWRSLDVGVLHEIVLGQGCGLGGEDFEDQARVAYTRDPGGAVRAVDSGAYKLAVFLNPTPVEQVLRVAREGEVMPPKSTYFHPKPLTGIVLHRLDAG